MRITLVPAPVLQPVEVFIFADAIKIGSVKAVTDNPSYKYHVILNSVYNQSIYQGFGTTLDAAMTDAINVSKKLRHKELEELDKLENVVWGDHELNQ